MNDLVAVEKIAGWEKLKALVLDSVSSPITKRVYNMALNEFLVWFKPQHRLERCIAITPGHIRTVVPFAVFQVQMRDPIVVLFDEGHRIGGKCCNFDGVLEIGQ